jgi:starch phosphorylase
MKVVLNGGLNLSVLDGWWAEGFDGSNGWGIDGSIDPDHGHQDHQHSQALVELLSKEVLPTFYDRGKDGIPRRWVQMVKASLMTLGPQFSATRMMRDYETTIYPGN